MRSFSQPRRPGLGCQRGTAGGGRLDGRSGRTRCEGADPTRLLTWATMRSVVTLVEAGLWRRTPLTVSGLVLDVLGIALVSMDFWWPWFTKLWSRVRRRAIERTTRVLERARLAAERLVLRLRGRKLVSAQFHLPLESEITASGEVAFQKGKSNTQLVRELGELNARVARLEATVEENREAVISGVQEMIRRSKDQYLGARIVGLAFALAGSVLLALANLAPS
jgi:hypothetical protein